VRASLPIASTLIKDLANAPLKELYVRRRGLNLASDFHRADRADTLLAPVPEWPKFRAGKSKVSIQMAKNDPR
jgi:hypothetical protein